eukprot:c13053_g1_i1 orf=2-250(-)
MVFKHLKKWSRQVSFSRFQLYSRHLTEHQNCALVSTKCLGWLDFQLAIDSLVHCFKYSCRVVPNYARAEVASLKQIMSCTLFA